LIELLSSNALEGIPKSELKLSEMDNFSIGDAFTKVGLTSSKAEAKRLASSGGLSINHNRITDTQALLKNIINLTHANSDMLPMLLRVGKKQYHLIKFIK
jgi:tyrosyl-tRNA synthetase